MKLLASILLAALPLLTPSPAAAGQPVFYPVDVYVDAGDRALAAWQFEFLYDAGTVRIVGVEGGDEPFAEAPWYDPKGLDRGRIIIATFTTDGNPPKGCVRVARLHLMSEGRADRDPAVHLILSAGPDGEPFEANIEARVESGGDHE